MSEQGAKGTPDGYLLAARAEYAICESGVANPRCARRPKAIGQAFHAIPCRSAQSALRCPDGAAKPDALSMHMLDQYEAYPDVCVHGLPPLLLPGLIPLAG